MITGIGIDLIELRRIKALMKKTDRFVNRILTEKERSLFFQLHNEERKVEFLAGRFAAKEAFAKATGRGIGKLSFQHIEILRHPNGAPTMHVEGYEAYEIFISITHSKDYAAAQVVLQIN
ncbi:holo-ACP synthase [Virgibacillus sp. W0430]|uniref:holo-ACP synthase n=1 Tax=Virgibacillus sp. W0430 TaxID=3391580 RepID=UPI003F46AD0C